MRLLTTAALVLCLAAPAAADVTITATTSGKAMGGDAGGQAITYIKGGKLRTDTPGQQMSTIIDLEAQRFISINHKRKEAEVHDLGKLAQEVQQATKGSPKVSFAPNGQTRQILDQSCAGYDMRIEMPFAPGEGMDMNIVLSGPVWVAKGAPGSADYSAFYKQAAEKGMFFTDPRQAKAAPGQAKGMAEMYRAMADVGMAYAMDVQVNIEGGGPMAGILGRMGRTNIATTVTNVSTSPVAADMFEVPAGFKVKTR
jgi:hypothetical protein